MRTSGHFCLSHLVFDSDLGYLCDEACGISNKSFLTRRHPATHATESNPWCYIVPFSRLLVLVLVPVCVCARVCVCA